jgi:hypothetical protein
MRRWKVVSSMIPAPRASSRNATTCLIRLREAPCEGSDGVIRTPRQPVVRPRAGTAREAAEPANPPTSRQPPFGDTPSPTRAASRVSSQTRRRPSIHQVLLSASLTNAHPSRRSITITSWPPSSRFTISPSGCGTLSAARPSGGIRARSGGGSEARATGTAVSLDDGAAEARATGTAVSLDDAAEGEAPYRFGPELPRLARKTRRTRNPTNGTK